MIQDVSGGSPNQSALSQWEQAGNMTTVPVLGDGNYIAWPYYEADWYIPTVVHLGPNMEVLSVDQGITDPSPFLN